MPIEYRIDQDRQLVVSRGYGIVTTDDILTYQKEVWSRPDVSGYNELADTSDIREFAAVGDMNRIAKDSADLDTRNAPAKLAIVAQRDLAFGFGRMFQAQREQAPGSKREVAVFRSFEEALTWLGVMHI